jgi:hypothetical protein
VLFRPRRSSDWELIFPDGLRSADVRAAATKIVTVSWSALFLPLPTYLCAQDHCKAERGIVESFEERKHRHDESGIDVAIVPWSAASETQMAVSLAVLLHKTAQKIVTRGGAAAAFPAKWRFHVMLDVEDPGA